MNKVSIITVNYNQCQLTLDLLESLADQDYTNIEVIVVDNGSAGNDAEIIQAQYPGAKVIRSHRNLGFAGGNNLGIREATGKYLFFVNNDTEIPEGTIKNLIWKFDLNESLGAISPLIYYYDHPQTIQYAGSTEINPFTGRNQSLGYGQSMKMSDQFVRTAYAHGAAMMISRKVIETVGPMPENYFLYYEELDWVHQMKRKGFDVAVSHDARIYHKESMSTGKESELKTYFQTRNRILFMRKNFQGVLWLSFITYFLLIAFPKRILEFLIKSKFQHLKSFLAAVRWHLNHDIHSEHLGYKFNYLK